MSREILKKNQKNYRAVRLPLAAAGGEDGQDGQNGQDGQRASWCGEQRFLVSGGKVPLPGSDGDAERRPR